MPPRKRAAEQADGGGDAWAPAAGGGGEAAAAPQRRAAKKAKKEPAEKRTAPDGRTVRKLGAPSQQIRDRIARALPGSAHRMFLVSTRELRPAGAPGGRAHEFAVLGATGNVYTVEISRHPSCTCPDFPRSQLCKHVLFVYLRALKMSPQDELIWQKALLTSEVEEILSGRHSTSSNSGDVLASATVRNQYAWLMGQPTAAAGGAAGGSKSVRRPVEGDCPVCFDSMAEGREALSWCAFCGNNIHAACCDAWARAKRAQRAAVTCCYCRADWRDGARGGAPGGAGGAGGSGGGGGAATSPGGRTYINLADISEAHRGVSLASLYPSTSHYFDRDWRRDS
ncbi:MAG: hypothetical protein J3K34DRAFT_523179 [Monoraphidium minutum]|nr:MAG: hypothetical protein J3K34DRAFT_523179 [Monoraphidium minutum]